MELTTLNAQAVQANLPATRLMLKLTVGNTQNTDIQTTQVINICMQPM
jgi:hypothetical protein